MRRMTVWLCALVLALVLSGCVAVTEQGVVFTIRPIVDYRVPAPEVVEALDEIAEEQGVDVAEACIDLQTADAETLQHIVHIGPVRAENIVLLRNLFDFSSADDLRILNGIGERRLAQIKEQGIVCG